MRVYNNFFSVLNVEEFVGSLMTDFVGYRWTDGWMNKCMNGLAAYVDDCLVVYKLWLSWLVMKLKKIEKYIQPNCHL